MWQVVEEASFVTAVAQFGDARKLDEALAPIMNAIYRNPLAFGVVPGTSDVRLARTKFAIRDLETILAMRLWFRADLSSHTVYLLWTEIAPPEDMGYGESLWDADEQPF